MRSPPPRYTPPSGVGRPQKRRILLPITPATPFTRCTKALRSNLDFDGRVSLVLERRGEGEAGVA